MFQPYEFGDWYAKSTAIWGDFEFPKRLYTKADFEEKREEYKGLDFVKNIEDLIKKDIFVEDPTEFATTEYLKKTGYSKRTALRSVTPSGFANAFYKANKKRLMRR